LCASPTDALNEHPPLHTLTPVLAGHYATALIAQQRTKTSAILYFLIACQFPDFLWLGFHYLGLEHTEPTDAFALTLDTMHVEMMYSHDVLPTLLWMAVVAGIGTALYRNWKVGAVGAGLLGVHAVTDFFVGFPHGVFGPDSPRVGLGLYETAPYVAVTLELLFTVAVLVWFFRTDARAGIAYARTSLVLFAAVFGGGIAFMYLVASTTLAELLGLGAVDVGFGTAIPTLILTYVAMTFALSKAMRARKSMAPPAQT